MEITLGKGKGQISFTIREKEINGIIGSNRLEIADYICFSSLLNSYIAVDGDQLTSQEIKKYKQKVGFVRKEIQPFYLRYKVYEYFYYEMKNSEIILIDPRKKIIDTLKVVGLDISYLNRNIRDLSSSEVKLLQLGAVLMFNPEIIVIVDPFEHFDRRVSKDIMTLFQKMKDFYDKTFVFISDDIDMLYQYATYLLVGGQKQILLEGETKEVCEQIEVFKKNRIPLPEIVEITYLLQKKGMKIDYHRDLRDLMKDIYKHV